MRASIFSVRAGTSVTRFAITPSITDGSQIARMQIGYAITVRLKCAMRFAVRQKMQMCGNAMLESGMNV